MKQHKLHPSMRPAGWANEVFQRKLDAEQDVERVTAVVQSIRRKLAGGSHAVTADDLVERQDELLQAHSVLATANAECETQAH